MHVRRDDRSNLVPAGANDIQSPVGRGNSALPYIQELHQQTLLPTLTGAPIIICFHMTTPMIENSEAVYSEQEFSTSESESEQDSQPEPEVVRRPMRLSNFTLQFKLTASKLRKLLKFERWRIRWNSIEFSEGVRELHGGHASVSIALYRSNAFQTKVS